MKTNYRSIYFFILLLGFSLQSLSQVNDAGLWLSLNVEKKITTRCTAVLSEEIRLNENISEVGSAFTDVGIQYKVFKRIFVSGNYRFIQNRNLDDSYSFRHRYYFDVAGKFKFNKLNATLRERFESQYKNLQSSENGKLPDNKLRSKLTLKFDLNKRYTPYLSGELFYQLNNPQGNEIDKTRYTLGVDYETNKFFSFAVFYFINMKHNVKNPLTEYVIGAGVTWKP